MENYSFDHGSHTAMAHVSCFRGSCGVDEYHLMVRPTEPGSFESHLDSIHRAYGEALAELGLEEDTAVLRRFFCSDLSNQVSALEKHRSSNRDGSVSRCSISWVGQPPVPDAKVALWAYHVKDPTGGLDLCRKNGTSTLRRGTLSHQWTTGITSPNGSTAFDQTRGVFRRYDAMLRAGDLSIADHVVRTWLFVRNIDVNYRGMVDARAEFFADNGLTPDTHFIASSGIEGSTARPDATIAMDAYAIAGVRPEQLSYLTAPDHLGPTHTYGVTFERATSVAYRDRIHIILSGTASIDPDGRILYPGDMPRQLDRSLENIDALLDTAGATRRDMGSFVVYVRDASDHATVWRRMRERVGEAPIQVVKAPVCRPGWLVEVEGTAVIAADNPDLPPF